MPIQEKTTFWGTELDMPSHMGKAAQLTGAMDNGPKHDLANELRSEMAQKGLNALTVAEFL